MKKVAFIGFGELGRQIHALAKSIHGEFEAVAFDDVCFANGIEKGGVKTFYPFYSYKDEQFKNCSFFICLGYKHLEAKKKIIDFLLENEYILPSLVHPSSFVNPNSYIGSAVYLYPMCNIDKGVHIGNGVLLNNSVTISHDTKVEECSYLSPGVITSGLVSIGACTFVGSGAIISNGISIGKNVTIGLGTVVTQDITDGCSAVGNPVRILGSKINLV